MKPNKLDSNDPYNMQQSLDIKAAEFWIDVLTISIKSFFFFSLLRARPLVVPLSTTRNSKYTGPNP